MKILYHHRTLGDGAEGIHIAEMVNAFRKLGHEVLLMGPGVEKGPGEEKKSNRFVWVKNIFRGPAYELVELAYNLFAFRNFNNVIREFKPDFIYDRYITFNYSAVAAGRRNKIPVFLEVNAPLAYERDNEPDETLYLKKIAYGIEKKVCCDASKTIVVSTPLKDYLLSMGVPEEKVYVLPNGVNTDNFFPRPKSERLMQELHLDTNDIVIGFVGILRPWHGIDILLEAFKRVNDENPDSKLLLVGDGHIRNEIEKRAEKIGVKDKLIITGRVPHDKVAEYVALFDIAISPKATFYASPMKIIEYMAQQKAVVAPDMANLRDLINNGKNGVLFEPESVESISATLKTLVADNSQREALGGQALSAVSNKLNWVANAQSVIDAFYKLSG
jgi:glycosyltransferase involved in cell wall biosynthesis